MSIYKPAGPAIQNIDFRLLTSGTTAVASGTLLLTAIDLPLGFPIANVYWFSGTTPLTNGSSPHYWVGVFDSSRNLKAQSTDNTSKTIAASSLITDACAYTTTVDGQYFIGIMVNSGSGGTQPTISTFGGLSAVMGTNSVAGAKFNGTSTTTLGATAPDPAGAITQTGALPWVGVS